VRDMIVKAQMYIILSNGL